MKITMTLNVPDPADVDEDDPTGLTNPAYDRLSDAIGEAGFEWEQGPDKVTP